jgi:hypothetical protein
MSGLIIGLLIGTVTGWYLNGIPGGIEFPKPHMGPTRWETMWATVKRGGTFGLAAVGLVGMLWMLGGCS